MPAPTSAPPLVNAPAAVPSLRTLGTGATEAAAGDDTRLTTPTGAVVTPEANKIPKANGFGKIHVNWLPLSTNVVNAAGAVNLSQTGVAPGTYSLATRTAAVDAYGRISSVTQGDVDLEGQRILYHAVNGRASGLAGDGIVDETAGNIQAVEAKCLVDGAAGVLELGPGAYYFGANHTIPATITLRPLPGCRILVPNGVTLTIGHLEVGDYKCFELTGTGRVAILSAPTIYARNFGAVGNASADDTVPIQQALDALTQPWEAYGPNARSSVLCFGAGSYRITAPLRVTRGLGCRITGTGSSESMIYWDGAADLSLLQLYNCMRVALSDLRLQGNAAALKKPKVVLEVTGDTNDPDVIYPATSCTFDRLVIVGGATYGVLLNYAAGSAPSANDLHTFTNITCANCDEANFSFGTSAADSGANIVDIAFRQCHALTAKYGVKLYMGTYSWIGGYVAGHTGANFWCEGGVNQPIHIQDVNSESSSRFLEVGENSYPWLFHIEDVRISTALLNADTYVIKTGNPGPFKFEHCLFGMGGQPIPSFYHKIVGSKAGTFSYDECQFAMDGSMEGVQWTINGLGKVYKNRCMFFTTGNMSTTTGFARDGLTDETPGMAAVIAHALNGQAASDLTLEAGQYLYSTDYAFPATVTVRPQPGAVINISPGVKLTIPKFAAALHQCFNINATPVITHGSAGGGDATVTPNPFTELRVKCTTGGALGTAEFAFSQNGAAFSAPVTSVGPGPWVYQIPNLACPAELTLTAGNYVQDEIVYSIKHAALYLTDVDTIYPEWFGGKADWVTDNSAAFQRALDVLTRPTTPYGSWGYGPGRMELQAGDYIFRTPIRMNRARGTSIVGKGIMQTFLSYYGLAPVTPDYFVDFYNCRNLIVENVAIRQKSGFPTKYVVKVEVELATAESVPSTGFNWANVLVDATKTLPSGGSDVAMGYIHIGSNSNGDLGSFHKCSFLNAKVDGFQLGDNLIASSNMKLFQFHDCVFSNATVNGFHIPHAGEAHFYGCSMSLNGVDFALDYPCDTFSVYNTRSERSGRFLTTGMAYPGGSNGPMPVYIQGCAYSASQLNPDGYMIITKHTGPMEFRNNIFGMEGDAVPKMLHVVPEHTPAAPCAGQILYECNIFSAEGADVTDFNETSGTGTPLLILRNNLYYKGNGPGISPTPRARTETRLVGIKSLSSDPVVQANNLCGSFNFTGDNLSVVVAFATNEPDANYRLLITPTGYDADAPAGSNRLLYVTKAVNGFTAFFEAAPGVGNTNTFDWLLAR